MRAKASAALRGAGPRVVVVVRHVFVQPVQQRVQFGEHFAAAWRRGRFARIRGSRASACVKRGVAQEQARRETLDGAAHDAVGVLGLDLAVDLDAQFAERPVGGEHVGDIAERVLMGGKPGVGGDVDAPAHHVLALVVSRRQPQHLDHAGGRRIVAIDGAVGDAQAHVRTTADQE